MKYETPFHPVSTAAVFRTDPMGDTMGDLHWALMEKAMKKGMDRSSSDTLTDQLMRAVYDCQCADSDKSGRARAALDRALDHIRKFPLQERCDQMLQMLVGFGRAASDTLLEHLDDLPACMEVYAQTVDPDLPPATDQDERELYQKLVNRVSRLHLSPLGLRVLGKRRFHKNSYLVSAAALGHESYVLKCAAAMDLYLRNRQFTPLQAAAAACFELDLEVLDGRVRWCRRLEVILRWLLGGAVGLVLAAMLTTLVFSRTVTLGIHLICLILALTCSGCIDLAELAVRLAHLGTCGAARLWDLAAPRKCRLRASIRQIEEDITQMRIALAAAEDEEDEEDEDDEEEEQDDDEEPVPFFRGMWQDDDDD